MQYSDSALASRLYRIHLLSLYQLMILSRCSLLHTIGKSCGTVLNRALLHTEASTSIKESSFYSRKYQGVVFSTSQSQNISRSICSLLHSLLHTIGKSCGTVLNRATEASRNIKESSFYSRKYQGVVLLLQKISRSRLFLHSILEKN